MFLKMREVIF
ncbi:UNVERIFIED_CONTAM: hypothetical protein GTU68_005289 [Idotea baltica]|nr:hypothetical protein [Idotea baltica]